MAGRQVLDFRLGTPWSDAALRRFQGAAETAWADPRHPASEGRRAAAWLDAAIATVQGLTGARYVAFHPTRETALDAALLPLGAARACAAATHRTAVLQRMHQIAPVDLEGTAQWPACDVVVLQAANEETGVIDRYDGDATVVVDATNAFGRVPVDLDAGVVIADARAWGSPASVAMLLSMSPLGPSTVADLPGLVVAIEALSDTWHDMAARTAREADAIDAFEHRVLTALPDVLLHGAVRVPHIRSLSVAHVDGETLMRALDVRGFAVGSGSACVLDGTPSHVLAAMGALTHGNLRIALPVHLDLAVLEAFADVLVDTVQQVRRDAGVDDL